MDESKKRRRPLTWILVGVAVLLVIGFLIYESVVSNQLKQSLPQDSGPIVFTETGQAETFNLEKSALFAASPQKIGEYTVLESAVGPGGEKVVLADKPDTAGTILGIVKDGAVTPLVSNGSPKADLKILPQGIVVYVVYSRGIVWAASVPQITPEMTAPAPGDIEGHATGPIDDGIPFKTPGNAAPAGSVELFAVDLAHSGAPRSLGFGKNPRIRTDGSLVALTPDGVARVDATTGAHTVIVPRIHGDGLGSTLSDDGAVALFRSDGSLVADVYAVGEKDGAYAGTIVSSGNVFGAAFSGESHIFIRTALNRASLFVVQAKAAAAQPATSVVPILNVPILNAQ
jgi:hypothetical protein